MKKLSSILVALGAFGATTACESSDGAPFFVSEENEIAVGAETHAQLISETPVFSDPVVDDYVNDLGQELVRKSGRPNLQHRFYVLDTPEINAFAVPGGWVYVTTGLLENMQSKAELAGVMGHEVGHVSAYHGAKAMQTQFGLSLLSQVLLGGSPEMQQVLEYTSGAYLSTAHSQDQELEADELGVEYSAHAGYNPWGLVGFFDLISELSGQGDPISDFLSSHPAPSDRIKMSSSQIEGLGISKNDSKYVNDATDVPFSDIRQLVANRMRR